ncbi:MAG: ABC transporter substrate-binding protein [Pseudomonadota bacterium]
MKMSLFVTMALVGTVSLIAGSLSQAKEVRGVSDTTIKIGFIGDQTGPASSILALAAQAVRTYARHINERGGVHGRQLQILVEDDRYSIPAAISAFKKLVYKDKIFALIGPGSASFVPVLWRRIQKDKLPTMCLPFTELAVEPYKRYLFITSDTYEGQMRTLVDYIVKDYNLKEPRIGLIYPDTEAGKTDLRAALPRLKKYNLEPVTREVLVPGALDAATQVMSLRKYKVNCVLTAGTITATAVTLLRELKKMGLKIPVFTSYAAMLTEGLNHIGDAGEQAYSIHAMSPWYGEGEGVATMREVTLKYQPGTEKPYRGTAYTYGWVMTTVLVEGLRRAGKDFDEERLVETLEALKNYETGELCNPITYSSQSHKGGNSSKIYKVDPVARKYVAITGWRKSE